MPKAKFNPKDKAALSEAKKVATPAKTTAIEKVSSKESRTEARGVVVHQVASGSDTADVYMKLYDVRNDPAKGGRIGAVPAGNYYVFAPRMFNDAKSKDAKSKEGDEQDNSAKVADATIAKFTKVPKDRFAVGQQANVTTFFVELGTKGNHIVTPGENNKGTPFVFGYTCDLVHTEAEVRRTEFRLLNKEPFNQAYIGKSPADDPRTARYLEDYAQEAIKFMPNEVASTQLVSMHQSMDDAMRDKFTATFDHMASSSANRLQGGKDALEMGGTVLVCMTRRNAGEDQPPSVKDETKYDWYYYTGVSMASNQGSLPKGYMELGAQSVSFTYPQIGQHKGSVLLKLAAEMAIFDDEKIVASYDLANRDSNGDRPATGTEFVGLKLTVPISVFMSGMQLTRIHDGLTMASHANMIETIVPVTPKDYGKNPDLWVNWTSPDMPTYCKERGIPVDFATVCAYKGPEMPDLGYKVDPISTITAARCGFQCLTSDPANALKTTQTFLEKQTGYRVECVGFVSMEQPDYDVSATFDASDHVNLSHDNLYDRLVNQEGDDRAKNTEVLLNIRKHINGKNEHNVVFYSFLVKEEDDESSDDDQPEEAAPEEAKAEAKSDAKRSSGGESSSANKRTKR